MKKILVLACFLTVSTSFAARLGVSGCGLGSAVINTNDQWGQVISGILNGISSNQTFGISSGTLNCGGVSRSASIQFLDTNRPQITMELGQGEGETLSALLGLLGCEQNHQTVMSGLQSQFSQILPNEDVSSEQMAINLSHVLENNYRANCLPTVASR